VKTTPRKYHESRYRLQATVPLDLLAEIEKIARERKHVLSRTIEGLLRSGLKDYYKEIEDLKFAEDLEDAKAADRLLRASRGPSK